MLADLAPRRDTSRSRFGDGQEAFVAAADKIMFEIYREADYGRQFRVVYFTELNEHNKESEIGRAMAGEHFFDGFVRESRRDDAKRFLTDVIRQLNSGHALTADEVENQLRERELLA